MKPIIRHFCILISICTVLFGMPIPGRAEGAADLELQYITEAGQGPLYSLKGLQTATSELMIYSVATPQGLRSGLMDPFGTVVLPAAFQEILYLTENYFAVGSSSGYALYYGKLSLTDPVYKSIYVRDKDICGNRIDGFDDFFLISDEYIVEPKIPQGWILYDYIPNKVLLLKQLRESEIFMGVPSYYYIAATWSGELILNTKSNYEIRIGENEILWSLYESMYVIGNKAFRVDDDDLIDRSSKYLIRRSHDYTATHYVYDSEGNVCHKFTAVGFHTISNYTAMFLTEDTILYQDAMSHYKVIDVYGKELFSGAGSLVDFSFGTYLDTCIFNRGFALCKDGISTYYAADFSSEFTFEGTGFVNLAQNTLEAHGSDGRHYLYSLDGYLLYSGTEKDRPEIFNGVFFRTNGSRRVVCNSHGELISDYIYASVEESGISGLVNLYCPSRGGYFLVNEEGVELNKKPFDAPVQFGEDRVAAYSCGGKWGTLRLYKDGDLRFFDVPETRWYYEAVEYCAQKALFSGTAAGLFSPDKPMTRAMLVTVLWRLDGQQPATQKADFVDVEEHIWYADAVAWASQWGIVNGVGHDRFDPEGNVTREQVALILRRYLESKGMSVDKTADLSTFSDAGQISPYAVDALSWANAEGLINGIGSVGSVLLQPKGYATRAQLAAIFMRYMETFL